MSTRGVDVLLLLIVGAGCGRGPIVCADDADCPNATTCVKSGGLSTGSCACAADEACKAGEFCNSAHVCQRKTACRVSSDCDDSAAYCDIVSGSCLPFGARCTTTLACPYGSVCDLESHDCRVGCWEHGDCPLGWSCDRRGLSSPRMLGTCVQGCNDKTFCEFGQFCRQGTCVDDENAVRCEPCSGSDSDRCSGDPGTFCLVNGLFDPIDPSMGSAEYCAPSCELELDCPFGYTCISIRSLPPGTECHGPEDCSGRPCIKGEGEAQGGCACLTNEDCNPISKCRTDGRCERDPGLDCSNDGDCVCRDRECVGNGRSCQGPDDCHLVCAEGSCLVGRACALLEGLVCPVVRGS